MAQNELIRDPIDFFPWLPKTSTWDGRGPRSNPNVCLLDGKDNASTL
jgi:hypothetical protein